MNARLAQQPQAWDRTLAECEAVIERGRQTFVEVGLALLEIRDGRLYRETHATFEDYCQTRWGWRRRHGYELIDAARVVENVRLNAQSSPSLTQAVALAPLPVEEQREVASTVDFSQTTVHELQRVVRERKEAKSHAVAHEERIEASRRRQEARMAEPDVAVLPFDRIAYGTDALTYLTRLGAGVADVCVTSPPYWKKRTYLPGDPLEVGQEARPEDYVTRLCAVLDAVGRVLKPDGCLFLNLGDTLASQPGQHRGDPARRRGVSDQAARANGTAGAGRVFDVPDKSFCLIPERVVLALVLEHGWRLSGRVVWQKLGHQPENVHDRLTQAWEPVFILTRSEHAYFLRAPGRDDVWPIAVGRRGGAAGHLAPFPEELVERAIEHACPPGGVALDPFAGSGTVLEVCRRLGRRFLGCDLAGDPPGSRPGEMNPHDDAGRWRC